MYTRRAKDSFSADRLDAEYFSPRVQTLLSMLSRQKLTVGDVAPLRRQHFVPKNHADFSYIEISDLGANGEAGSSPVEAAEAPDRATWYVRKGDVITSTVRPVRRLSAIIKPDQDGFVCSSGFAVLRPTDVSPEVLLTYLRLPAIAQLMDLHTTASLYPAISVPDILNIPFVKPSAGTAKAIIKAVQDSHAARQESESLLARAKRAVEVAIEQDEAAGLRFLQDSAAPIKATVYRCNKK